MKPLHQQYLERPEDIKTFTTKEELEEEKAEVLQSVEQDFISITTPKISQLANKAILSKEDAEEFNALYSEILKIMEEHKENISNEQYQKMYTQVENIKREAWRDLAKYYVIPPTAPEPSDRPQQETVIDTEEEPIVTEEEDSEYSTISVWE